MAAHNAAASGLPRQQDRTNVFGRNSPSENICLPEGIPVTAVEFYTYLPNAQRNYNALIRFVQAGVTQIAVEKIINYHRRWAKRPAHPNSICKLMQESMREQGGHAGWTVRGHKAGNYNYPRQWNQGDLMLDNVQLNCDVNPSFDDRGQRRYPPINDFPFAELAVDVYIHPSYARGDGYLLTRCVQYAAARPEKNYVFPGDFAYLAKKLDDGRQLEDRHLDQLSITRWLARAPLMVGVLPDAETFEDVEDSDDDGGSKDGGNDDDNHEFWVAVNEEHEVTEALDLSEAPRPRREVSNQDNLQVDVGFGQPQQLVGFECHPLAAGYARHPPGAAFRQRQAVARAEFGQGLADFNPHPLVAEYREPRAVTAPDQPRAAAGVNKAHRMLGLRRLRGLAQV